MIPPDESSDCGSFDDRDEPQERCTICKLIIPAGHVVWECAALKPWCDDEYCEAPYCTACAGSITIDENDGEENKAGHGL